MSKLLRILSSIGLSVIFDRATVTSFAGGTELHIAEDGRDSASGRADAPFRTLERARDEIRKMRAIDAVPKGGVLVVVHRGVYRFERPMELSAEDSGTVDEPIVWRAQRGGEVRLTGAKAVEGWRLLTDPVRLQRLDKLAWGKVWVADLRAQGITNFGEMKSGSSWGVSEPGLELFFRDSPMTLARWPNHDFAEIANVFGATAKKINGVKGTVEGIFSVDNDRIRRWVGEPDIMAHGYWFFDWADQRQKVETLDIKDRIITLGKPYHTYGYRKGQRFYVYNLLSELDSPGEWYLDRDKGIIYFWPPSSLEASSATVSLLPTLMTMTDVSHVTFQGFVLEGAQGTAVSILGGADVTLAGCVIRNCGSWGVQVVGGLRHRVIDCDIYQVGDGGVKLQGGDRATLTAAGHSVENCHIHHYSRWNMVYKPAIQLDGVGNRAAHNLIDDAPHMGIGFSGNDDVIEFNEIYRVVQESNDAGAIYAGRDLGMRGNIIRYNYIHDVSGRNGLGCMGIYLDDELSSVTVFGNIFCRVTRAVMIGGGQDNVIRNNIFVDCSPAIQMDARGLHLGTEALNYLTKTLEKMPYRTPPWSTRYPQLPRLFDDKPFAPKGNVISTNICCGGRWVAIEESCFPYISVENNLLEKDPEFVDVKARDYRLRSNSPAWKIGFQEIPPGDIGLYRDRLRTSLPARSE